MPVIICTGFNESMDPAKSEALGIRAYLMKPLKIQELATTIHRVLEEASPASP
jgi:two-component system cell cycle sensor histidine kinase/response regulator CckA